VKADAMADAGLSVFPFRKDEPGVCRRRKDPGLIMVNKRTNLFVLWFLTLVLAATGARHTARSTLRHYGILARPGGWLPLSGRVL